MVDKPHLDEAALAELQDVMEDEFGVLIETYLKDSRERIESLKAAIRSGDADALTKTAHSFKGSCINIGTPRLGELCRKAEEAGRSARIQDAADLMPAIEAEFQTVAERLRTLLAQGD